MLQKSINYLTYEVDNLEDARNFFNSRLSTQQVILVNSRGSCFRYGVLVVCHIFQKLIAEFHNEIFDARLFVEDYASYVSAKTLNISGIKIIYYNQKTYHVVET